MSDNRLNHRPTGFLASVILHEDEFEQLEVPHSDRIHGDTADISFLSDGYIRATFWKNPAVNGISDKKLAESLITAIEKVRNGVLKPQ